MDSNITINGLTVKFRTGHGMVTAVENVNTVFEAGKITGLIGESGSGKSVLGMSILQLLPNSAIIEGECLYKGDNLLRVRPETIRSIRGREIALIPQNPSESLNSVRRIKRQLTEAVTTHDKKKKDEAQQRAQELLQRFGFADPDEIMRRYSFQMSGGMNQRIISVLGLMDSPSWIIADEPTKGARFHSAKAGVPDAEGYCTARHRQYDPHYTRHYTSGAALRQYFSFVCRASIGAGADGGGAEQPSAPLYQGASCLPAV